MASWLHLDNCLVQLAGVKMRFIAALIVCASMMLCEQAFAFDADAFAKDVGQTQMVDCDSMADNGGASASNLGSNNCGGSSNRRHDSMGSSIESEMMVDRVR